MASKRLRLWREWNKRPIMQVVLTSMDETFTQRMLELQKDPTYFNPQQLEKLKIVFDRVCVEMGIADIRVDQRQRDKLATIILVGSRLYPDEDELVKAAIIAMHLPGEPFTPRPCPLF